VIYKDTGTASTSPPILVITDMAGLEKAEAWPPKQEVIDRLTSEEFQRWGGLDRAKMVCKLSG